MFRLVSPAGTPTRLTDLTRMVGSRLGSGDSSLQFEQKLKQVTGAEHCFLFGSGRTALTTLLTSVVADSDPIQDEVIIPAYTCFSVPAAIIRAGLKIRLVDIDPENLDYDASQLSQLNLERVLAIVGCNLFGILTNMERLRKLIGNKPVTLIDDAAQSLGCRSDREVSGCRGQAGLYSLGRGKNLSTYAGGVLVTDDEHLAKRVRALVDKFPPVSRFSELSTAMRIALTGLLLKPALYWFPANLPFLKLGQTVFDTTFDMNKLSRVQASLGTVMIDKLEELNAGRQKVAALIARKTIATGLFKVPGFDPERDTPCYLRLPLLARDRDHRDQTIVAMRKVGIMASIMYPSTIGQIDGIKEYINNGSEHFPGAQHVVDNMLTLPTHGYVTDADVGRMINVLRELDNSHNG